MPLKILYGVQGEGRGHATRSIHLIKELRRQGYQVKVVTGGEALDIFAQNKIPTYTIPILRYFYNKEGSLSLFHTATKNFKIALSIFLEKGPTFKNLNTIFNLYKPDFVISDFEPYVCRMAKLNKVPIVSVNHQTFLTQTQLPKINSFRKNFQIKIFQFFIKKLVHSPDVNICSSFFHFPKKKNSNTRLVGPYINTQNFDDFSKKQNQICVYLKSQHYLKFLLNTIKESSNYNFVIFSKWKNLPSGSQIVIPNIQFEQINQKKFLNTLSQSKALITTAGNQVLGEAIYCGVPILAFPEPNIVEQELNSQALNLSQFGLSFELKKFNKDFFESFLEKFPKRLPTNKTSWKENYDGTRATMNVINNFAFNGDGKAILSSQVAPTHFPEFIKAAS